MERLEFEARVGRAKLLARGDSERYRRRLSWLVTLGMAVPIVVWAVLAAITLASLAAVASGLVAALWITLVAGASAVHLGRAIMRRPPPVDGITVSRSEAPRLHEMVREVAARTQTPLPDEIYVVPTLTAWARQVPRTSFLATGSTSAIGIGLPLLHAMDPDELKSVLAHEFGHLAGRDGLLMARMNRLRSSWQALMQRQGSAWTP